MLLYPAIKFNTTSYRLIRGNTNMTLNISLLSRYVMAQSSDLRLTDPHTGALVEDASPKQVQIGYFTWQAVIGYSGVAQVGGYRTHKWLADLLAHPTQGKESQLGGGVQLIRQKASKALAARAVIGAPHSLGSVDLLGSKGIAYM